ncbi:MULTISPECIES: hypothetical protein [unclassified Pseudoalteromonas]|uniref:hypothetical protein n=1 Tax=unclassified Pseudoalteromonas TaxID=194690 RepID=UPI00110AD5AF|nr:MULTISPECIES: hypothetical protein [unclassified Pseudoalteromonas]MBA6410892.1 hypothetical protein [Pseudoalteromonas sp. 5Ae-yellow]TMN94241.1 hypothetical protein CWB66_20260 [Pseudoalteromonas sp. S558]
MNKFIQILIVCIIFSISGCTEGKTKMDYKISDISDITYKITDKEVELSYTPLMESLYYSPGVDLLEDNGEIVIHIRRCNINSKCEVDAQAEQGSSNKVKFELKQNYLASQIYLNEKNNTNSLAALARN